MAEFAQNNVIFGIIDEWILTNNKPLKFFRSGSSGYLQIVTPTILFVLDYVLGLHSNIIIDLGSEAV